MSMANVLCNRWYFKKEPLYYTCDLINLWSLVSKRLKLYSFLIIKPWTVVTDVINKRLDTFANSVNIMLNLEPQI